MSPLKNPRLQEIVEEARRDNRRRARRIREREKRVRAFLPVLVQAFRDIDPSIERIVLFGSLAGRRVRTENFDIDDARAHIAERIRTQGQVLYAAEERLRNPDR